jgi:FixJ family two-component response regulator
MTRVLESPQLGTWLLSVMKTPVALPPSFRWKGARHGSLASFRTSARSHLVFVVDDDPGMLRAVAKLLRQIGYASFLFPSADAFANHGHFDGVLCILLDIDLGDASGINLRYRLKAAGNTVPVVYMTGNDSPAVRMTAFQSGCLSYLTKPFSARSLKEALVSVSAA